MTGGPRWHVLLALAVAIGCGDDPAVPEPEPAPVSVAIEPAYVLLGGIDTSVDLEWVAYNAQGQRLTRRGVKWTSSDPQVARLEAVIVESTSYDAVRVTSQSPGTATITATWQGTTATAVINVGQVGLTAPDTLRALGDTARVDALDRSGRPVPNEYFDWTSDDESVLVVDSTGLVTAVGNGSTKVGIRLRDTEHTNNVLVSVAQLATSVSSVAVADTLRAFGDTLRLNAEAHDANGHPVPADLLSWSSADDSVVAVAGPGLVTAVGNGTAEVFAASRRDTAGAAVTVEQRAVSVRVLPSAETLRALRDTLRLGVELFDANGHALPQARVPLPVAWSSNDESVATVDHEGLVTAAGEGAVEITARLAEAAFVGTTSIRVQFVGERDVLAALYHSTGGPRWRNNQNWLTDAPLESWHGVEIDDEGRVTSLKLGSGNGLSGSIPPEIGYLDGLRELSLSQNQLTGTVPRQLGRLENLKTLNLSSNRLTGPIPAQLGALESLDALLLSHNALEATIPAELGKLRSLRVLEMSHNRLTGGVPSQLSALKELIWLSLNNNKLTGAIPSELGTLSNLQALYLGHNRLTGEIPRELGNLVKLHTLSFSTFSGGNRLSGSIPPELGRLSNLRELGLSNLGLTGEIPRELGNLTNLELLYIDFNELTGAIPAWLGDLSHLRRLYLSWNQLSGPLPPELGRLSELEDLYVWSNRLEGQLPVDLANLTRLKGLLLSRNPQLTGPLQPALGALPHLRSLAVDSTGLSGPIPREFVGLRLLRFEWSDSKLCAPLDPAFQAWLETIPTRLEGPPCVADALAALYDAAGGAGWTNAGNWLTEAPVSDWHGVATDADGRITSLDLRDNGLAGTVPPEIGVLRDLTHLDLADNALGGKLPAEVGQLGGLRQLHLSGNRFAGALPGSLTKLTALADFQWDESGLCASPAAWFREWLGTIANHASGPNCSSLLRLSVPAAHVNQAAQDLEGTVPLIAGRTGFLRVFATADQANDQQPGARATFSLNGREVHRAEMELASEYGIPEDAVSGQPDQYFRTRIPGDVLAPGVEMVVEFDPDSTVPRAPGSVVRYPPQGRAALDVRELPRWELTVVPVLAAQDPDSTVLDWVAGMGPRHPAIEYVTNILPVGEHSVRLREPFVRSPAPLMDLRDWSFFLREIRLLRAIEAGTGTYYGVIGGRPDGIGGVASVHVAVGKPRLYVVAHELGHTMGLGHAPCGLVFDADPLYPYSDGSIGVWGYDARGDSLVPPATADVMGYCANRPNWISDYHFDKALRHLLETANIAPRTAARETAAKRGRHLLLWGGSSLDGELGLDPAFVIDMPSQLPTRQGPYRLEGFGSDGEPEFSLDFAMEDIPHGGGTFLFAIPFEEDWHGSLQRIMLTGPEGMVELNEDGQDPVALVLDLQTGRLRSVLRGEDAVAASAAAAADATTPGNLLPHARTVVSYGLPGRVPPN